MPPLATVEAIDANQAMTITVGQIAAVEPVGPLPKIARQVLGADAVMSADEPGFDVAEQGGRFGPGIGHMGGFGRR